jgi:hypothetical protein
MKMDAVQNSNPGGGYMPSSGTSRFDPGREIWGYVPKGVFHDYCDVLSGAVKIGNSLTILLDIMKKDFVPSTVQ